MTNKEILKLFFEIVKKHYFNMELKVCAYDNWYQKFEMELNLHKIFYQTPLEKVLEMQDEFKNDLLFLQEEDELKFSCSEHFTDDKEFEEKRTASYCLFTNSEAHQISTFIKEDLKEDANYILLNFNISVSIQTKENVKSLIDLVYQEVSGK